MKPVECPFEAEVLSAVLQATWPERADAELKAHVETCPICGDVAAIAGAFEDARVEMRASASIPDSGHVWRSAQLRAWREAAEAANRPMAAVQIVAFVCAAALLLTNFRTLWGWLQAGYAWAGQGVAALDGNGFVAAASKAVAEHGVLALAMVALLLLVPAAALVAIGRD